MSQRSDYQGQHHPELTNTLKGGPVSLTNGQPPPLPHSHNGNQPLNFNSTGTPSSQSSRETSRDPSPTQYLHQNQYRPQLTRPPMPPINGQSFTNSTPHQMPPLRQQFSLPLTTYPNPNQPLKSTTEIPSLPIQDASSGSNLNTINSMSTTNAIPRLNSQTINSPSNPAQSLSQTNQRVPVLPYPSSTTNNSSWNPINSNEAPTNPQTQNNNFGITTTPKSPPPITTTTTTSSIPQSKPPLTSQFAQVPSGPPRAMNTNSQNIFGNQQQQQQPRYSAKEIPSTQATYGPPLPPSTHLATQYPNQMNPPAAMGTTLPMNQTIFRSQPNIPSQRKYPSYEASTLGPGAQFAGPPLMTPGKDQLAGEIAGQYPGKVIGPPPLTRQQMQSAADNRQPFYNQMSNVPLDNIPKRYPAPYPNDANQLNTQMGSLNVTQSGYNELWGQQSLDLLQCRNILPAEKVEPPKIKLHQEHMDIVNCSPDIFRCTLTKIPDSNGLLQRARLPLGILIHPFKDLNHLPLIQCSTIVRCRACRTYINPYVYFVDSKRWKCNLCYRVNELPDEFQFDPVTKSYGDPTRRPEVKTSTIEFIAPSEYMLRPPQPAVYLFLLDVSRLAVESGYLTIVCEVIADELSKLPGDGRMQVGFLAIDSAIHFFSMPDNVSQPHELIMLDVDDVFLPCPDNLIVNLKEREELVRDLLAQLPMKFHGTHDTNSALGAGLQVAQKLMSGTGGRITVFQTCLPNVGPGSLQSREDPNARASKDVPHLNPATDFYKRLALDCSGQQIAVDLFLLNSQYSDLATLSGMCKFSGGCIYHLPLFRLNKPHYKETLERMLRRYLTRKIGFEAVMRIRCTRGLGIHTFHGNFFVRSTDLLSLPNVNPDAGFGMQVSIEENLSDTQSVCFQAALLYTSSKGERRIRVHTLCLPVTGSLTDILYSADQQAIIGLVSKMAVDRSQSSSLSDARDALINVAIDAFSAYKLSQSVMSGALMAPGNLKLLPLYIVALLKCMAFRTGTSTRLDDRVYTMCQMKALPLYQLIQMIYPDLYPIHNFDDRNSKEIDGRVYPLAPRLHLSAEKLDFRGAFLMDAGDKIFIYIGKSIDPMFCSNVLGVPSFTSIPEEMYELPELNTPESDRVRNFVFSLQEEKPYYASIQIIRDDSQFRNLFVERLVEDRTESALSYYEFLQHLKTQVK